MRPTDAELEIKALAELLDVPSLLKKMREYEKAGYPTQSMGDGRGGESPCPVAVTPESEDWLPQHGMPPGRVLGPLDLTDRAVRAARLQVEQGLRHAVLALRPIVQTQNSWLIARTDDTEKAAKLKDAKTGVPCKNVFCDRWMSGLQDDVPRNGYCVRCYRWEKRHPGVDWQPKLEEAESVPPTGTTKTA